MGKVKELLAEVVKEETVALASAKIEKKAAQKRCIAVRDDNIEFFNEIAVEFFEGEWMELSSGGKCAYLSLNRGIFLYEFEIKEVTFVGLPSSYFIAIRKINKVAASCVSTVPPRMVYSGDFSNKKEVVRALYKEFSS